MNQKLIRMLNDAEQELLREVESDSLHELDEDQLLDLHTRVRRARTKYTKLYRRRAAQQVGSDGSRGRASAVNNAPRTKAEIFEDTLATVSRRLAAVAKQSATDLRAERLAARAARRSRSGSPRAPDRPRRSRPSAVATPP